MKLKSLKRSQLISCLFGSALALLGAGSAFGQARNAYLTIQPNAAKDAFVHTLSWVALDTQYSGSTYDNPLTVGVNEGDKDKINNNTSFGNFTSAGGSAFEIHSYNDPLGQTRFEYLPGIEVRYQPPHAGGVNSYAGGYVYLGTDGSDGAASSPVGNSTPKWDDVGSFITEPNGFYGSGWEGVTGIRTISPDGSGTQITGDGYYLDTDDVTGGSAIDDVGMALVGYDAATQAAPQTGYMQFVIPTATWDDDGDGGAVTPDVKSSTDLYFADPNGFWVASGWKAAYVAGVHTDNASIEVTVINDDTYTPKLAVAGDFDGDLDVDNADIGNLAGNFTGSAGEAKYYRDGDLDDDYDVDNADIGGVGGNFTGSTGSPVFQLENAAGTLLGAGSAAPVLPDNLILPSAGNLTDSPTIADLIYDPANGNVQLDATESPGGIITVFQFENAAGTFVPGNYISLTGGGFGGIFEDVTTLVIGDADLTGAGFGGLVDIGNVFPTGLDLTGLEAYLTTAVVTGAFGNPQTDIDLVVATVIPEPSSVILLGLFGVTSLLIARRRRK